MRTVKRFGLAVIVGALGMAVIGGARLAPAALAQTTPSSLAGETFSSTSGSVSGTCTSPNIGSFTFSTSGTATGPYPGTFTESGSFTINSGVTAFSATFAITSGTNTVSGSKSLLGGGGGACDFPVNPIGIINIVPAITTTYTATINGAYQDTGTATVNLDGIESGALTLFSETFTTSNGVVPLAPPLQLNLLVNPTTATTGTPVTASATLTNNTSQSQTVTGTVTLAFTGSSGGSLRLPVPFRLTLAPNQTVSKSVSFTIQSWFPRGTYTVTAVASDSAGSATSSASLTVH
jgi:hypothetical protein